MNTRYIMLIYEDATLCYILYTTIGGTNLFFPMRKKMEADRKTTPSLPTQSHSLSVTRNLRRVLPSKSLILRKYNHIFELRFHILLLRRNKSLTLKGFYRSVCMF